MDLPAESYPGLDLMEEVLSLDGVTSEQAASALGEPKRKVRTALSALVRLGLLARERRGRSYLYRRLNGTILDGFLRSCGSLMPMMLFGATTSDLSRRFRGARSTRMKKARFAVKLAIDLGLAVRDRRRAVLTERGTVYMMALEAERIYLEETGGRLHYPVPLTPIRRRLESLGVERELFDGLFPRAVRELVKAKLSPSPPTSDLVVRDAIRDRRGRLLYFLTIGGVRWIGL